MAIESRHCKSFCRAASGRLFVAIWLILLLLKNAAGASLDLLEQEIIQDAGADLVVNGYAVPAVVDWDNDGRKDLVVGEKTISGTGKIRVYLNIGTDNDPCFGSSFYVQSSGSDLTAPASGCLGAAPCIVYWNAGSKKDLLVGRADGKVIIYHNISTDASPSFDGGAEVQVGPSGGKGPINVGGRAMPVWADWNNDGRKDLLVGDLNGRIRLYLNSGTDTAPDFLTESFISCGGSDLTVPLQRAAPTVIDFDGDGKKDIVTGNTNGQLFFYHNVGTDAAPAFTTHVPLKSIGTAVQLLPSGSRSRPFICDWDNDGTCDILVGYGDGKVYLFKGTFPGDLDYNRVIDMRDFAIFSWQWLSVSNLTADIAPCTGDNVVNTLDLTVFTDNWLNGLAEF